MDAEELWSRRVDVMSAGTAVTPSAPKPYPVIWSRLDW